MLPSGGATRAAPRALELPVQRAAIATLSLLILMVCAACAPQAPARAEPSVKPLHAGPITDLVPAAGLRWLVVARLRELYASPALRSELERLFPAARLDAFAQASGVELRDSPSALAAGFDLGTLYIAETPGENAIAEARLMDRMSTPPRRFVTHPSLSRLEGTSRGEPLGLVRQDSRLVATAVGDLTYGRVAELYLLGKLKRSPSALRGSALSTLPAELSRAPLRLFAPGPLPAEWASGARGLLGAALALGVGAWPEPGPEGIIGVRLHVVLSGLWKGEDVERLAAGWEDLAESNMGRLLSLDHPLAPPQVKLEAEHLLLDVRLPLGPLVSGLRAAVMADVWEILEISDGIPSTHPGRLPGALAFARTPRPVL